MFSILTGNCQSVLSTYGENFFHSCITDPPYGMGMDHWDHSVPDVDIWREVYRTLRPGAFCLAFCSPELYHRLACNVEDAGFMIKDQIMWMTTTKMPKYNKLKPAHEPIVVAQKPYKGTLKEVERMAPTRTLRRREARRVGGTSHPTVGARAGKRPALFFYFTVASRRRTCSLHVER